MGGKESTIVTEKQQWEKVEEWRAFEGAVVRDWGWSVASEVLASGVRFKGAPSHPIIFHIP